MIHGDDSGPRQWGPAELAGLVRSTSPAGLRDVLNGPRRRAVLHGAASGMAGVFRSARAPDLRAVIHWRVGGRDDGTDTFELVIADGVCTLSPAPTGAPKVALSLSAVDFVLMVTGLASPLALFMRGRMRAVGDIGLTMRLPSLFDIPRPGPASGT
ncbi:SCP2 sterol-binding domain-containing protein [Actinoplanes siamensis]|uniref:SCP2 sterol-binding domain-containing protein n=1 Tax=Actinoplanes siamensis TaxID=1223317 RepID=UPI001EF35F8E|nr:SCP2 sterol-binding domain-containing protein [Actinoplanes siamensis]